MNDLRNASLPRLQTVKKSTIGQEIPGLSLLNRFYPESRIGRLSDIDGTVSFYAHVNVLFSFDSVVLDVGCGRGAWDKDPILFRRFLRTFKGRCKQVIGIDVDPKASANPYIDQFRLIKKDRWPVDDASVDIAVADYVIEHIREPEKFFAELARVVKPGGYACIRTPNLLSYFGVISALIPSRSHTAILHKLWADEVSECDVFPTFYKCNTRRSLRRALAAVGFDAVVYGFDSAPNYLVFSTMAYYFGVLHQRFAPNVLKVNLFAFAAKK